MRQDNTYYLFDFYKFTYSADGFLNRVNTYDRHGKLQDIYNLNYSDGNLSSITNSFSEGRRHDYAFMYYDQSATVNTNFILKILLHFNIHNQNGTDYFDSVPSEMFGKLSKNLIKAITVKGHYDNLPKGFYTGDEDKLNISYQFDNNGLVTEMVIGDTNFSINYKKIN